MNTNYPETRATLQVEDIQVLEKAAEILEKQWVQSPELTSASAARAFVQLKLAFQEREVFAVILLNSKHQYLDYQELFFGTIDGASVYPREVVKAALGMNAAAVILVHNHPSGETEPSHADRQITKTLVDALSLIDVKVLDHFIVGRQCFSFAENQLL